MKLLESLGKAHIMYRKPAGRAVIPNDADRRFGATVPETSQTASVIQIQQILAGSLLAPGQRDLKSYWLSISHNARAAGLTGMGRDLSADGPVPTAVSDSHSCEGPDGDGRSPRDNDESEAGFPEVAAGCPYRGHQGPRPAVCPQSAGRCQRGPLSPTRPGSPPLSIGEGGQRDRALTAESAVGLANDHQG